MNFTFNAYYTLIAAVIVLLIGKFLVNRIEFLRNIIFQNLLLVVL
jgi:ESS family glutamate:Na+ symporter